MVLFHKDTDKGAFIHRIQRLCKQNMMHAFDMLFCKPFSLLFRLYSQHALEKEQTHNSCGQAYLKPVR